MVAVAAAQVLLEALLLPAVAAVLVHRVLFQGLQLYMQLVAAVLLVIPELLLDKILVLPECLEQAAHLALVELVGHVTTHVMHLEQMEVRRDLVVAAARPMVALVVMARLVLQFLVVRFEQVVAH